MMIPTAPQPTRTRARLPSLTAVQAFLASARSSSFTQAAQQLHMTHSGVSRHIQALEHWCGQALFVRHGPRVALTEHGRVLLEQLDQPLAQLHQILQDPYAGYVATSAPLTLHIRTLPSIAHTWLLPLLPSLVKELPQVALSIHTGYEMTELPPHLPCVAIRYGHFNAEGLDITSLGQERSFPAATTQWLDQHGDDPAQWPSHQFLRHIGVGWPKRLVHQDGRRVLLPGALGIEFNDAAVTLHSAALGLGVTWARERLAQPFVQSGQLVGLTQWIQQTDRSYWLVYRSDMAEHPAVQAFSRWLVRQESANSGPKV